MAMQERRQVGIASDQFCWQSIVNDSGHGDSQAATSMPRIRHCAECPNCHTRYLLSCSPYRNGSRLVPAVQGSWDDYILYCSCTPGNAASRIRADELKRCDVSREAYRRGYGTAKEIGLVDRRPKDALTLDLPPYLDQTKSPDKRRNSP